MGEPGSPTAAVPGLSAPTEAQAHWEFLIALGSTARFLSWAAKLFEVVKCSVRAEDYQAGISVLIW